MAPSAVDNHAIDPAVAPQPHEEYQYLQLIRDILRNGENRPDRTGTGTRSIPFPPQHKYSLSRPDGTLILPLLTTKRVFLRAVIAELLWFVAGDTNAKTLQDQNVKIWDGNASRAYLDSVGLKHRDEGDLGPVYGFQWRHFGAEYETCHTDYSGKGVDQLAEVVKKLNETPYDRRIILSAWNPADLKSMALPPCHMFAQFYVSFPLTPNGEKPDRGTLHTLLYQRSCDMGLGVPFNIASYALLAHMLAHTCCLIPGTLTHTMGDAHVYNDHVDALEQQILREPRDFPTLDIARNQGGSIDGWSLDDFKTALRCCRIETVPQEEHEVLLRTFPGFTQTLDDCITVKKQGLTSKNYIMILSLSDVEPIKFSKRMERTLRAHE
nr:thymidylate synthase [Quercus suber]